MQCKDIPDIPILKYLAARVGKEYDNGGGWCFWYSPKICGERSIANAMPTETPEKLVRVKMLNLIRRHLVSGCGCGCRGDFEITDAGLEYLEENDTQSELAV